MQKLKCSTFSESYSSLKIAIAQHSTAFISFEKVKPLFKKRWSENKNT